MKNFNVRSIFWVFIFTFLQGCSSLTYEQRMAIEHPQFDVCKFDAVEMCSRTFLGLPWDPRESNNILCHAGDCECHERLEAASWKNNHTVNGFTETTPLRTCEEVEK
jgi:hypothetical protein